MATQDKAVQDPVVVAAEFTTIPFTGVPMTKAIQDGYGANAKSPADIAAMTKAKITDFKANFSYEFAVRIGVVNTGTAEVPVFEDRYEMKKVNVYADIVTGSFEYYNAVMTGNAYNPGVAVVTTLPPTTTIPV